MFPEKSPCRVKFQLISGNFGKGTKFSSSAMRTAPNILITGTPGTGKSSLAEMLMHNFDGLKHLNISELIKERKLGDKYNEECDTWEFDDDKVALLSAM